MKLSIFVSHEHHDKKLLSEVRDIFTFHGIQFFLAHEDIGGGRNYITRIEEELNNCDIFLLYANERSQGSFFCNQEIGWRKFDTLTLGSMA